ncbi:alternative oxidase [Streptomyces boninensis]|uniref:alternative oxidase n=1 Tax=Streptomyces boninensis TaxID=2039455 RepID=UPI003B2131F6
MTTTLTAPETTPAPPAGAPPKLSADDLRLAQLETLNAPRLRYGLLARALFKQMDLVYGKQRTLVKFTMLEFIARVPYQAWERMGYHALSRVRRRSGLAKRVHERIAETREEQDNEQWHLLILQDLVQRAGHKQSFLLHRLAPWLVAFVYYHVSWLLFLVKPELSYRLNADFEDHAEHEYMAYVAEHPELERTPAPTTYAAEYGHYATVADLLRQIGHDERTHKEDSLVHMKAPRFVDSGYASR